MNMPTVRMAALQICITTLLLNIGTPVSSDGWNYTLYSGYYSWREANAVCAESDQAVLSTQSKHELEVVMSLMNYWWNMEYLTSSVWTKLLVSDSSTTERTNLSWTSSCGQEEFRISYGEFNKSCFKLSKDGLTNTYHTYSYELWPCNGRLSVICQKKLDSCWFQEDTPTVCKPDIILGFPTSLTKCKEDCLKNDECGAIMTTSDEKECLGLNLRCCHSNVTVCQDGSCIGNDLWHPIFSSIPHRKRCSEFCFSLYETCVGDVQNATCGCDCQGSSLSIFIRVKTCYAGNYNSSMPDAPTTTPFSHQRDITVTSITTATAATTAATTFVTDAAANATSSNVITSIKTANVHSPDPITSIATASTVSFTPSLPSISVTIATATTATSTPAALTRISVSPSVDTGDIPTTTAVNPVDIPADLVIDPVPGAIAILTRPPTTTTASATDTTTTTTTDTTTTTATATATTTTTAAGITRIPVTSTVDSVEIHITTLDDSVVSPVTPTVDPVEIPATPTVDPVEISVTPAVDSVEIPVTPSLDPAEIPVTPTNTDATRNYLATAYTTDVTNAATSAVTLDIADVTNERTVADFTAEGAAVTDSVFAALTNKRTVAASSSAATAESSVIAPSVTDTIASTPSAATTTMSPPLSWTTLSSVTATKSFPSVSTITPPLRRFCPGICCHTSMNATSTNSDIYLSKLQMEKKKLSSYYRSKTCAPDQRPSAVNCGLSAIFLLSGLLLVLVILDWHRVIMWMHWKRKAYKNGICTR